MIGSLRGRIASKSPPQLTVEVGGLGYELEAPLSTFFHLPPLGEEVRLLTHLVVREDAHVLYAFGTEEERRLFRSLIKVSGVGPKIALALLSGISVTAFAECVQQGDISALTRVPGVGRKTANVILGNAFGIPGITVDTHFKRLVKRWRWTAEEDPDKIEHAVGELIERSEWTLLSHRVIFHGRRVCHARKPACGVCVLAKDCPSFGTGPTEPLIAAALVQGPETEHLLALAGL